MKPNDDVVGQTIINISEKIIYLSNGMELCIHKNFVVKDAGVLLPLKHWRTIENEKRIRIPETK